MTPAQRFADYIGGTIADAEHGIGIVRGGIQRMLARGRIVRKDGAAGLPSDDEIVDGLILARAGIDVRNELHAEAGAARAAVYADGVGPRVEMPSRRRFGVW